MMRTTDIIEEVVVQIPHYVRSIKENPLVYIECIWII